MRLAIWSGPRNISTAMMRSWDARTGCQVVDEPFYACYLQRTDKGGHPAREQVLASQPRQWRDVVRQLQERPLDGGMLYMKMMAQHLLPDCPLDWLADMRHGFLIRDPLQVVASYARVRPDPDAWDIGLARQLELFENIREGGGQPFVVDAADVLRNPCAMLRAICDHLQIAFDPAMLQWRKGPRPSDGVWGPHWYDRVWESTGFAPYKPPAPGLADGLSAAQMRAAQDSMAAYNALREHRLRAA